MSSGGGKGLIYVYAVVDAAPPELGLGLEGSPLRAVVAGPIAAVVSTHARAPEAREETLWQHEAVVERLMEDAAVLPLRFGTTVADEEDLVALLRSREAEFVDLLAAVRGAVELSVRAELPQSAPAPVAGGEELAPPSGTEYMRERGRALRSRERAIDELHKPLRALARRSQVLEARGGLRWAGDFRGAYLVDADRVEAFAAEVDRLAGELGAEISCTGPWPPYSFVAGAGR
jgi:hypothetical protein